MTLAARIIDRAAGLGRMPDCLVIDGRSGAGKSALAADLARLSAERGHRESAILSLEDLYPGWDGLAAGAAALPGVLETRALRRYDWSAGAFGALERLPEGALIIEGCGALTSAALAAARSRGVVWSVWLEAPAELRYRRAIARDGDVYAPHWERWAAQEHRHYTAVRPIRLATEVVHVGCGRASR